MKAILEIEIAVGDDDPRFNLDAFLFEVRRSVVELGVPFRSVARVVSREFEGGKNGKNGKNNNSP